MRHTVLTMPSPAASVRLLRDPFGVVSPPDHRLRERLEQRGTLVFSDDGRKVHACGKSGALLSLSIPNSANAGTGRTGVFLPPEGHVNLAVGQVRTRKRTVVLSQGDGALHWHTLTKRGNDAHTSVPLQAAEGPSWFTPQAPGRIAPLCVFSPSVAFFVDQECRLVAIRQGSAEILDCPGGWVLEARRSERHLACAMVDETGRHSILRYSVSNDGALVELSRAAVVENAKGGFFLGSSARGEVLAWASGATQWTVQNGNSQVAQRVGLGERVVGVIAEGHAHIKARLAVVDADRKRILAVQGDAVETLVVTQDTIEHAMVSPVSHHLACVTASGELLVYCLFARGVVVRARPGEAP